jgi:Branched-chain amino acid transport system / permease component
MPKLDSGRRRRAALTFISRYGTIMGLLAMIVFFAINAPGTFLSRANFLNILSQASLTAIISAGLTFTLVVGEFDLSIGNVASFIGLVVAGLMAKEHLPIPVAVALALLVGVVIGLVNGFLVKVRINAVIATIGVGTMLTGLGFSYRLASRAPSLKSRWGARCSACRIRCSSWRRCLSSCGPSSTRPIWARGCRRSAATLKPLVFQEFASIGRRCSPSRLRAFVRL